MAPTMLEQILAKTAAFAKKAGTYTTKEGFQVSVVAARDGLELSIPKVREIVLDDGFAAVATNAEGSSTTYLEIASIVAVSVRGTAETQKKRTGFA